MTSCRLGLAAPAGAATGDSFHSYETQEGTAKEDASIIPLGMPMLAGPGAISTVMVLVGQSHEVWQHVVVYSMIVLTSVTSYMILAGADRVRRYMGETGIRILMRLMGLLLVEFAVQFCCQIDLIDFRIC